MAGLIPSLYLGYISTALAFIPQPHFFLPHPLIFFFSISPNPQPSKSSLWSMDTVFPTVPSGSPVSEMPMVSYRFWDPHFKPTKSESMVMGPAIWILASILNNAYINPVFKSTMLKALRKQVYTINGWSVLHDPYAIKILFTLLFNLLIILFNMFCFCWKQSPATKRTSFQRPQSAGTGCYWKKI